jgi:adenylate cyclase
MSEIFVSYERSSAAQARAVAGALRALGYDVWIDDELPAHRAFDEVIEERLKSAKAVVVVWSAEAAKSQWVRSEANRARETRKLVQLSIDDTRLPMPFDQIHCVDLRGWTGDVDVPGWRRVLASIADLAGAQPAVAGRDMQTSSGLRQNSICVLPFSNMSGDAEQEYFSDGISEDIITDLSKVSALFVIARNTAFTFKGRAVDVQQVARQLDVSHILEGSVRKSGARVRITAQLIDGANGGHVWAERYDRDLRDIFALQDEIAEAIVTALKLKLLPAEKAEIEQRGTSNLEAYDLFLRGTRPAFGPDQHFVRITLLEAATQLAPDYADAWGELAKARQFWHWRRPYAERSAIAATATAEAERALTLDPRNIAALGALFYLLPPFGRFLDSEALLERMESIAPRNADVLIRRADHLLYVGRVREAIEVSKDALEIDPLDPLVANDHARMLSEGGRYTEARRRFEDLLSRWPDHMGAATNLILLGVRLQDWTAVDALVASGKSFGRGVLAYAAIMRNRSPDARRRLIESARRRFAESGTAGFGQVQLAALLGGADESYAIALRARFGPAGDAAEDDGINAYRPLIFGNFDGSLEFRRDPRFVKLCARCGLVEYWLTTQKWPDCVDEVAPYYDFKAECEKVAAGPRLALASEMGLPPDDR